MTRAVGKAPPTSLISDENAACGNRFPEPNVFCILVAVEREPGAG